ncbi:molybdenum cofactor biosynthesis protein MoaE [Sphingomonas sp.]|uniref:molybdenum cofactor biosynthesis protein MoaE n=1 Tax=Sphingomonas sp. TaxID=28214 RepID=UPI001B075694|nr:molybdenum cofactor biosynthesis protein MoaE [Sphingomonas sp.]MBO9712718.1 molybdenum cofactor biosynthesis protein MoaE [Sphingomonas sp.]
MIRVSVQPAPIDLATELAAVEVKEAGGIASFTGCVRGDDGVASLTLEHYPGMTEAALCDLAEEAFARWGLLAATIVHRVGEMVPGDRVVFVATAAVHRAEALAACAFLIDRLKTDAPFWKKEVRGEAAHWVEARAGDAERAAGWGEG